MQFNLLMIAGVFSFIASALHIGIVIGGPEWYRFFGAGERMAQMAEKSAWQPALITISIAIVLALWGAYAWSGSGILPKLPFLKFGLVVITGIYLTRGIVGIVAPFVTDHPQITQNSQSFWIWSSLICLGFGLVHLLGIYDRWQQL